MSFPPFPTKAELLALIADRKNDLQHPSLELNPPGEQSHSGNDWEHMRTRENRIQEIRQSFSDRKQKLEQDFDMNS